LTNKAAKGKKGTIVATLELKLKLLEALSKKHSLNDEIQFLK
jgi:hypothetical protein